MKKTRIIGLIAFSMLSLSICNVSAQVDLKKLGGKAVDKAKDKKESNKQEANDSGKKEADSKSNIKVESSDSGYDLMLKGDKEYEAENWKDALAYYEAAKSKGENDGMMTMKMNKCKEYMNSNPEEEKKKKAEISSLLNKMEESRYKITPVDDDGFTHDFHKQNAGKIVFSKSEIAKSTTSDAAFGNKFSSTEDLYARVYLSRSMTNEAYSIGAYPTLSFTYRITVDGQTFPSFAADEIQVPGDGEVYKKWTTFQLALTPKASDVPEYPSSEMNNFFTKMYSLPEGNHKVKIELVFDIPEDTQGNQYGENKMLYTTKFGPERIVASGEFDFNITQAGKTAMGKKLCPNLPYLNNHVKLVPTAFEMVNGSKRENEKVVKVVVLGSDWTYAKNGYGIIVSRSLKGMAIILNTKTKLCEEVPLTFHEENISSGGSKYGKTTFSRSGGDYTYFLEDCIK
jgi:hypothetical protein